MMDHDNRRIRLKGYPPEVAVYKSILQLNNIHGKDGNEYKFLDFENYKDDGLRRMASSFYNLLDSNSDRKVNLTEIMEIWANPPYGIKNGIAPILAVAFYLARSDKIVLL